MQLNMALPCRISVFSQKGKVHIGCIRPAVILAALSDDEQLKRIAQEVEGRILKMISEAGQESFICIFQSGVLFIDYAHFAGTARVVSDYILLPDPFEFIDPAAANREQVIFF